MSEIDADYGQPRSRQGVVAVVVALVFLAVIGGSVGFILASNRGGDDNAGGGGTSESASPAASATDEHTADPGGTNTRTRTATPTRTYRTPSRDACPQQTADALGGADLHLVLYVRTGRSEAWICQYQGMTIYQGHVRGRPFPAATSDHSILVRNVRYDAGTRTHAATIGSTVYYVNTERLRIVRDGNEQSNEAVEDHNP